MFNAYGWALIDWFLQGGNYYTMRHLVEISTTEDDLAKNIAQQSTYTYNAALSLAKAVFGVIKDQIAHDEEVRASLKL